MPGGDHGTTHFSMTNGSSAVVKFTGTGITVFGNLMLSKATPISVTFSLDDGQPVRRTLPTTAVFCLHNQAFFQSTPLQNTSHSLTINVTDVHDVPFILDYVWLCDNPTNPPGARFSRYDGVIVGSVLGGVFFVLGIVALAWFCVRRRNRRRQLRQLKVAASPVHSWLHRQQKSGSGGSDIVFTSTESIMRDNPEYWSSEGSKTEPKHLLSLPITSTFNSPELPPGLGLSNMSPHNTDPDRPAGLTPPPWSVQGRVR
ncbi:hypothetical protein C8Q78DRAFT_1082401 [Trametes maxima]|nr:hypothetical protein C8Q78DRAFT_1082401 [Trametes maxima]